MKDNVVSPVLGVVLLVVVTVILAAIIAAFVCGQTPVETNDTCTTPTPTPYWECDECEVFQNEYGFSILLIQECWQVTPTTTTPQPYTDCQLYLDPGYNYVQWRGQDMPASELVNLTDHQVTSVFKSDGNGSWLSYVPNLESFGFVEDFTLELNGFYYIYANISIAINTCYERAV